MKDKSNRKLKDSGIEWIGKVPAEWNVERLQWHLFEINEKNDPIKTIDVLSLTNKKGVLPYEEKGNQGNKSKENYSEYKIAYKDTIVANSMNILIGSVGYSNFYGCVSPVYYIFKEYKGNNLRFFNYILSTSEFQRELKKYANGILEIRLRLSSDDILKRIVPVPNYKEQCKIADFLDSKCFKIDKIINDINKQIETLVNYKKSLINDLVTGKKVLVGAKQCEPEKTKDSGIEWIRAIPSNWKVSKLKYMFTFGKGLPITKANLIEDGLPVVSYGQIHSKDNNKVSIDKKLKRFVDTIFATLYPQCEVYQYDFIFADTSEDLDGCGNCVYNRDDDKLFAGYHSIVLHSINKKDNRYFAYLFLTDIWRTQITNYVNGVKVFSITQGILQKTYITEPPECEKDNIADYLDNKCSKIDKIISDKKQQIESLEKYKKSLIFEYVTGKKQV